MTDNALDRSQLAEERRAVFRRFGRTAMRGRRTLALARIMYWNAAVTVASENKRAVDFLVSLTVLMLLSPLLLIGCLLSGLSFQVTPRLGQWCRIFHELSWDTSRRLGGPLLRLFGLRRLPVLINILRGEMSFIGPLPTSPGEMHPLDRAARKRYTVRPGLISLWWIRQRTNIDYGTQQDADTEYVDNQTLWGDVGIALRAVPALFYGTGPPTASNALSVLGIPINNLTMAEALDMILEWTHAEGTRQVCFVNADCANIAFRNKPYLDVLRKADLCLADGIGLKIAGKMLGREIRQNVNGTDLFPKLCEALTGRPGGLFLLGARDGVAQGVAEWIHAQFPEVRVCGWQHGYFQPEQEPDIIRQIKDSGAHVLLVAFGAPRQDMWIYEHAQDTGVSVAMGVGGLFDFYSGRVSRAPLWVREIGMEWVYRLVQEPGRLWKRYLVGNGLFLWRVFGERLSGHDRGPVE